MILIPNLVLGALTDNLESHQFFEVGKKKKMCFFCTYIVLTIMIFHPILKLNSI